jgi:hypothetical protein
LPSWQADHTPTEVLAQGLFYLENRTVEYHFNDADFAARYAAIKEGGGDDLSSEIALLRLLIERAAPSAPALAGNLLSVLVKSQSAEMDRRQREGELLGRHELFQIGSAICAALVEKLSGFPNFDQIVDAAIPAIESAIATAGREQPREPLRLTHDPQASGEQHHARPSD